MTRPWRIRYAGAKYHLTARGNGREEIFLETADYERFLEQLAEALETDEVDLYAYVLMPNHYHLLVETPLGNVQRFMQRLNTAYSMYFRYKKSRPGHCFQGRYGAKLVDGDDYLVRLTRYIHLNPVKMKRLKDAGAAEKIKVLEGYSLVRHGLATGEKKMLAIELLCRLSSVTQRGLVQYCGYKREANVGLQRKLFRARIRSDASFAGRFALLENKLKRIVK